MAPRAVIEQDAQDAARALSPAVLDALRGRSLFLTGGTGFIGKWLLEVLLAANAGQGLNLRITVLTRDPQAFTLRHPHLSQGPGVCLHRGNVEDFAFPPGRFDLALHAALPVAALANEGQGLAERAELGVARVCSFAAQAGVARLLHVSSGAIYGAQAGTGAVNESAPWTEPAANDYTRAKRAAERYLGAQAWPFDVVIARCFAFIGPYLEATSGSAAAQFIDAVAADGGITIQGDGTPVRSYQYAADMARWLITLLALAPAGTACNVGSGEPVTIAQLAARVAAFAGSDCDVAVLGQPRPGLAGNIYLPTVALAHELLGLDNRVGLDEAIHRTLTWRKAALTPEET
jgi:nucleoside-diphosphate-sugar epimerase